MLTYLLNKTAKEDRPERGFFVFVQQIADYDIFLSRGDHVGFNQATGVFFAALGSYHR